MVYTGGPWTSVADEWSMSRPPSTRSAPRPWTTDAGSAFMYGTFINEKKTFRARDNEKKGAREAAFRGPHALVAMLGMCARNADHASATLRRTAASYTSCSYLISQLECTSNLPPRNRTLNLTSTVTRSGCTPRSDDVVTTEFPAALLLPRNNLMAVRTGRFSPNDATPT